MSPRELDALRRQFVAEQKQAESASKWQLANDIVSGISDIVGRGVISPILGMPGDINQAIYDAGAWVNNKIKDVEVATGMVKQPRYVQPTQGNAYLGSEDIGSRMQQAGLVSSERRPMTELAASLVSPSAAAKTAINAPKTAMNMLRMAENLEAPSRGMRNAQGMYIPRGQMGAIDLGVAEAPQAKALREAQINAAKPVSEGGLGLRPDNTPEERAAAMGGQDVYHATDKQFDAFVPSDRGKLGRGAYTAFEPEYTEKYIGNQSPPRMFVPNASVMPLKSFGKYSNREEHAVASELARKELSQGGVPISIPEWKDKTSEILQKQGFAGIDMGGERVIFDPSNIRSRFAAFDPMRRNSSDLLAGIALPVVAAPVVSESDKKKRKDKKK
jgi:hypothetical protein